MNNISQDLLSKAEKYVSKLLTEKLPKGMLFHTLEHTVYVVEGVRIIGHESGLSETDQRLTEFCAWFHDVGYLDSKNEHEEKSIEYALAFLKENGVSGSVVAQVRECILSTDVSIHPHDKLSEVLCDADMRHLAGPSYFKQIELLRKELSSGMGFKIKKSQFDLLNSQFFKMHTYYTAYGKAVLCPEKAKNLEKLFTRIRENEKKPEGSKKKPAPKPKEKPKGYSRGVESMFRLTARNQINLSSIADNKSNILISVNTIIISIVITVLIGKFDENPALILPTLTFLTFSLITIIFAILSTRPQISSGTFTKEDIQQNKVNLLFFGNFYNMKLDEYSWAIQELMKNDENLYNTMIKDQYSLGKVLAKKYKLLRISYNVFMFGLIISVLAFVVAFVGL
jgi:predicted metal-dependent HD superfamily phosphohydrolase